MLHHRTGFTLIELLTSIAALIIVLGVMVELARYVRNRSAGATTRELLVKLDELMARYEQRERGYPAAPPLVDGQRADEAQLRQAALENNRAVVAVLRGRRDAAAAFRELPISVYDEASLRDAWGSPLVFVPPGAANVGMAPQNRAFFFSAGPDRRFSTLEDNLYSYEQVGGHRE